MDPTPRRRARALSVLTFVLGVAMLAGCASQTAPGGVPPTSGEPAGPLLKTPHAVTVLEAADGAQMCVGPMAMSYPPQCGGPALLDWDWAEWSGLYEESGGVRWGLFALTGRYDADAFTFAPDTVEPWRDDTPVVGEGAVPDFSTPCAEPRGGWRVLDPARTTDATMNETFERAGRLDGYAASWVDRSRVPAAGPDATPEQQLAETASSPELTIINVRVVGDVQAATAELRRVWGGMLCVSAATRTQAELQGIADEITADTPHGILGIAADGMTGSVHLDVIYDDGALQKRMDADHGAGMVVVGSTLLPASSE